MAPSMISKSSTETSHRGFGPLPCPKCGKSKSTISIDLEDLDGEEACQCRECNAVFSLELVREIISSWRAVLLWIVEAPKL